MKFIASTLYGLMILTLLSIAGLFLASLLPIPGHIAVKIVRSGSMEPALHVGSIVIIRPADAYRVGDIVTFGADTKTQIPTTHRIHAITNNNGGTLYATKGDANEEPDGATITRNEIIGKVIVSVPYAGYILDFARKPLGFATMIALPAALIILDELMRIFSELKRMRVARQRPKEQPDQIMTLDELRGRSSTIDGTRTIDGIRAHRPHI